MATLVVGMGVTRGFYDWYLLPARREQIRNNPYQITATLEPMAQSKRDDRIRTIALLHYSVPTPDTEENRNVVEAFLPFASPPLQKQLIEQALEDGLEPFTSMEWESVLNMAASLGKGRQKEVETTLSDLSTKMASEMKRNQTRDPQTFAMASLSLCELPFRTWSKQAKQDFIQVAPDILRRGKTGDWHLFSGDVYVTAAALQSEPELAVVKIHLSWRDPLNEREHIWPEATRDIEGVANAIRSEYGLPSLSRDALLTAVRQNPGLRTDDEMNRWKIFAGLANTPELRNEFFLSILPRDGRRLSFSDLFSYFPQTPEQMRGLFEATEKNDVRIYNPRDVRAIYTFLRNDICWDTTEGLALAKLLRQKLETSFYQEQFAYAKGDKRVLLDMALAREHGLPAVKQR